MAVSIKGGSMGNISVGNGALFIMTEGGEPMPLGNTIEIETIEEHSKDDLDEIIGSIHTSGEIEIDFIPDYFNQKVITELFFGTTNNYRRMHGGFALRERTKYKWYKRHKKRKE